MAGSVYNGLKGARYIAVRQIGEGGEGTIYEVQGSLDLVIKVYKEKINSDKQEKLNYMAGMAAPELLKFAAWPMDVIRDITGNICGFTMKKLVAFVPLHMLFSPMDRKKVFPDKGFNFLIHVARNLAIAFHHIHQLGIIVGDINEANILVSNTGMVALIDCDSFQVKNGNRYHFCEVGIPRYTPPELLEKGSFDQVVRTINTDSFSLATLIFQLLFLGRAPFTGINLSKEDFEEEKAIKLGEFAYSLRRLNKKLHPAKYSLDLNSLTSGLINSFHQAFEDRVSRPTPKQWVMDLEALAKEIKVCERSALHFYPNTLSKCPWCEFKDKAGIIYFFDDSHLRILPELHNIEQFVNGFRLEKIEIMKLAETFVSRTLKPARIDPRFRKYHQQNIVVLVATILLSIALFAIISFVSLILGLVFLLIYNRFSRSKKELRLEFTKRRATRDNLKSNFQALVVKHNEPAELKRYNQASTKLAGVITQYRRLPEDLIARKRKIEENYYDIKYQLYLQQFDIGHYPIPAFGPTKKQLIQKNGINTAADIQKLRSIKIPNIGPKNIQILFDWQRQIGAGFVYIPDTVSIDRDVSFAAGEIYVEKQQLQNAIRQEYQSIMVLRDSIITSTERLEKQYVALSNKLYQAELDMNAFQRLSGPWF